MWGAPPSRDKAEERLLCCGFCRSRSASSFAHSRVGVKFSFGDVIPQICVAPIKTESLPYCRLMILPLRGHRFYRFKYRDSVMIKHVFLLSWVPSGLRAGVKGQDVERGGRGEVPPQEGVDMILALFSPPPKIKPNRFSPRLWPPQVRPLPPPRTGLPPRRTGYPRPPRSKCPD